MPASYTATTVPELIAAMDAANLTPEADTIALVAGATYTLASVNNTTDGLNGLPVIAAGEDLAILGNGAVIERSTATGTPTFRLLDVAAGGTLALDNLTLQGGLAFGVGPAAAGGAIYSQGMVTLNRVAVQNNQAFGARGSNAFFWSGRDGYSYQPAGHGATAAGGGLFIGGGTALLTDVTLAANTAQGGQGGDGTTIPGIHTSRERYPKYQVPPGNGGAGFGGALYAAGGAITLRNTAMQSNAALGGTSGQGVGGSAGQGIGGGLYIEADVAALLDAVTLSKFKRNRASTSDPNVHGAYTVG